MKRGDNDTVMCVWGPTISIDTRTRLFNPKTSLVLLTVSMILISNSISVASFEVRNEEKFNGPSKAHQFREQYEKYKVVTRSAVGVNWLELGGIWDDMEGIITSKETIYATQLPADNHVIHSSAFTSYTSNIQGSIVSKIENYLMTIEQVCSSFARRGNGGDAGFNRLSHDQRNESFVISGVTTQHQEYFVPISRQSQVKDFNFSAIVRNPRSSHIVTSIKYGYRHDIVLTSALRGVTTPGIASLLRSVAKELQVMGKITESTRTKLGQLLQGFRVDHNSYVSSSSFCMQQISDALIDGNVTMAIESLPSVLEKMHSSNCKLVKLEFEMMPIEAFLGGMSRDDARLLSLRPNANLYPLLEFEKEALIDYIYEINWRKMELSLACDTIINARDAFALNKSGKLNEFVSLCDRLTKNKQKVDDNFPRIYSELRRDIKDNPELIQSLFKYADSAWGDEGIFANLYLDTARPRRFAELWLKLRANGVIELSGDDEVATLQSQAFPYEKSYIFHYDSRKIGRNSGLGEKDADEFERHAINMLSVAAVETTSVFLMRDCAKHICELYTYTRKSAYITVYNHNVIEYIDLLAFYDEREDYCDVKKRCTQHWNSDRYRFYIVVAPGQGSLRGNYLTKRCEVVAKFPYCTYKL